MPRKKGLGLPTQRTFVGPALIWKRIAAFVVDFLILNFTIFFPFRRILLELVPDVSSFQATYASLLANESLQEAIILVSIFMSAFALLYFVLMEYFVRTSPGKALFGISVVGSTKDMKFWQCLIRSMFVIPIFPFVLLWVFDPIFLLFSKTGQRLTEVLSKTNTVERYALG